MLALVFFEFVFLNCFVMYFAGWFLFCGGCGSRHFVIVVSGSLSGAARPEEDNA